jgi:invasion protein IalB
MPRARYAIAASLVVLMAGSASLVYVNERQLVRETAELADARIAPSLPTSPQGRLPADQFAATPPASVGPPAPESTPPALAKTDTDAAKDRAASSAPQAVFHPNRSDVPPAAPKPMAGPGRDEAGLRGQLAQQSAAAPAPAPAPKAAPKPAPKAALQAQPSQPQPAQPQQQQAQGEMPPVIYSPWTKFCGKDQNQAAAKEVCLTVREARLETGQFLAGAALIEQAGDDKKIFRITLPLGMQLPQGTRIVVDQNEPIALQYIVCLPNGCMADAAVNAEFVGKLKKGQNLVLQGINLPGQAASYPIPLADFAKANEGSPTDPKQFEAQQEKLQQELQKKAEDARKKLEQKNIPTPAPGAPAR